MPRKLLLAEDSLTMQKVVAITFAHEDFAVTAVASGEEALRKVRELQPDIVLADLSMPRPGGYELCEAIKADPATRHIPVLLLAGGLEPFDEARAQAAGASGHLNKPFETGALIERVRALAGAAPATAAAAPQPAPMQPAPMQPSQVRPMAPSRPSAPTGTQPRPFPTPPAPTPPQAYRPPPPRAPGAPVFPAPPAPPASQARPFPAPPPPRAPMPAAPPRPNTVAPNAARPVGLPLSQPLPTPGPSGAFAPRPPAPVRTPGPAGAMRPAMPAQMPAPAAPVRPAAPAALRPAAPAAPRMPGNDEITVEVEVPSLAPPRPAAPPSATDGGEAALRAALSAASREVIEKIAWEVVPQLAEVILREHIARREGGNS